MSIDIIPPPVVEFLGSILNSTFFHARFHNSQIRGTSNLLLSRLKLSFRLGFWRGTWADHNFAAFWGWRLLWDLTTMDAWKTSGDWMLEKYQVICKNLPANPARKRGCWSLEETSTNGLPSFYWSPCDSWAAFCAVGLRLHSPTILNTKSSSPTEKTSIIRVVH